MLFSLYRRFLGKTNVPIAVLSEYTEKEYEPLDPYSRFYPAMPVPVCFSDTALCTLSKIFGRFFCPYCSASISHRRWILNLFYRKIEGKAVRMIVHFMNSAHCYYYICRK